jgi:hypothetical protein
MFDFWFELPSVLRVVMGLAMMGIAGIIWYLSGGTVFAIGLAVVGFFFVLFSKSGDSGGYNF